MATIPNDAPIDLSTKDSCRYVERMLDDAVEDSFPASDPVALSMPHDHVESRMAVLRRAASPTTMFLLGGGLLALITYIALRR